MHSSWSHDVTILDRGISWGAVIARTIWESEMDGSFLSCPFSLHMHFQFKENSIARLVSIGATDNNHAYRGLSISQWGANTEQSFVGGGVLGARNADR